ncbi:MAG: hypothetical protein LWY06_16615 [Firmicutes bacterium]|nr:hypothetical protein [Bacillota bacterium]
MVLHETKAEQSFLPGCLIFMFSGALLGGLFGKFVISRFLQAMPEPDGIGIFTGVATGVIMGVVAGWIWNLFVARREREEEEF